MSEEKKPFPSKAQEAAAGKAIEWIETEYERERGVDQRDDEAVRVEALEEVDYLIGQLREGLDGEDGEKASYSLRGWLLIRSRLSDPSGGEETICSECGQDFRVVRMAPSGCAACGSSIPASRERAKVRYDPDELRKSVRRISGWLADGGPPPKEIRPDLYLLLSIVNGEVYPPPALAESERSRWALDAMDRAMDETPSTGVHSEDGRYTWPERWKRLRAILAPDGEEEADDA